MNFPCFVKRTDKNNPPSSSKVNKATAAGIPIMDEQWVLNQLELTSWSGLSSGTSSNGGSMQKTTSSSSSSSSTSNKVSKITNNVSRLFSNTAHCWLSLDSWTLHYFMSRDHITCHIAIFSTCCWTIFSNDTSSTSWTKVITSKCNRH